MALSRVSSTGWVQEEGTPTRVTSTGWVQETQASGGPVIGTTSVSANLGTESASTVNKAAAASIASDIGATAANTPAKIALVSLDAALCAEASITAAPVSAVSASVAAVLGIEQGETSTKLAIAALSAALGMESANTYQKVEAGVGVTTVAVSLGIDGTVSAIKLAGSSLASDIAADINAVTAKISLSSVASDGAIYGTVTAQPYTPSGGVTLSPEDIAAIADAVWAQVDIETGYNGKEAIRLLLAVLAGKTDIIDLGGGAAAVKFRDINDTKDRVTATMAGSERTSTTLDAT